MSKKSRSYEAREQRKCRSKKTYDTVKDAGIYAAHIWMNMKQMSRVYECQWCNKYHLTSEDN